MKRFLPLLCFFAAFHGVATSQDRLEPADSFYDIEVNEAYYRVIRDYLIPPENGWFMSRFWAIPSFSGEYFVGTKQEGERFFLICRRPEKHIWEDGRFHSSVQRSRSDYTPEIIEIKRCISKNDVRLLNLLIEVAVVGARFDQNIHFDKDEYDIRLKGFDGTNYFFSTSLPTRTATVWSPEKSLKTGQLVGIFEDVAELAKNGDIEFTPEFRTKIEELTEKFKSDI